MLASARAHISLSATGRRHHWRWCSLSPERSGYDSDSTTSSLGSVTISHLRRGREGCETGVRRV